MEHTNNKWIKALIFTTATCALALSPAVANGNDKQSADTHEVTQGDAQIWIYEKKAVTERAQLIRIDETQPHLVMPLNTRFDLVDTTTTLRTGSRDYSQGVDLRTFDLIEDSPIFIGAKGASEFDTRDAQYDTGGFPKTFDIDPLYTIAGAGVSTSF
ncbi:hypothetical protein [Algimonas arctica]|nr:hypothetical protein [Algimonas arctica]